VTGPDYCHTITDIEATGPGNRVTSDDVQRYIERSKG
jgi:hypothetical protein